MKDYTTIDIRTSKLEGVELVKEASVKCDTAIAKAPIWSQEAIPHKLKITLDQFKQFSKLHGFEDTKPTGKELFKTGGGYIMEIKVEDN